MKNHPKMTFRQRLAQLSGFALMLLIALIATNQSVHATEIVGGYRNPIPNLAYYYIWFDTHTWYGIKTDSPELGRYSSDDQAIMRQHIQWAKEAGIDGFIVGWKSTEKLDRRLAQLVEIAGQEAFKLSILYQGLDFYQEPISVEKIADDLDQFIERYAQHPVFDMFGQPMVILSGTWEFTTAEITYITQERRGQLYILASSRDVKGYKRLDHLVDGNAYYWSSVSPDTSMGYPEKLQEMGETVHSKRGLWIAPAAPEFDADKTNGIAGIGRREGQTLRSQLDTAISSAPDAIAIISWNEFRGNSHIEPSEKYGSFYLDVLNDVTETIVPQIVDFDSSMPGETRLGPNSLASYMKGSPLETLFGPDGIQFLRFEGQEGGQKIYASRIISLGIFAFLMLVSFCVVVWRSFTQIDDQED